MWGSVVLPVVLAGLLHAGLGQYIGFSAGGPGYNGLNLYCGPGIGAPGIGQLNNNQTKLCLSPYPPCSVSWT